MKRILFSGGLLAGETLAQAGAFLSRSQTEIGAALAVAGLVGLVIHLNRFTGALYDRLTEHGETLTF